MMFRRSTPAFGPDRLHNRRHMRSPFAIALGIALGFGSIVLPAAAQTTTGQPTTYTRIDQSLAEMLTAGWQVVGVSRDLGMQFVLRNENTYAICSLQTRASLQGTEASSECHQLN